MWAVVGLGNPGKRYASTRHNAGFLFVHRVAEDWNVRVKKKKFLARTAETVKDGVNILLAMPQTYMNLSGLAVRQVMEGKRMAADRLLVVYDDLDIALGEVRVRREGRAGTHRGMQSIVREIGTTKFPRIRLGIGPLPPGAEATEFVLSNFKSDELPLFEEELAKAQTVLGMILTGQITEAMNRYNRAGSREDGRRETTETMT